MLQAVLLIALAARAITPAEFGLLAGVLSASPRSFRRHSTWVCQHSLPWEPRRRTLPDGSIATALRLDSLTLVCYGGAQPLDAAGRTRDYSSGIFFPHFQLSYLDQRGAHG